MKKVIFPLTMLFWMAFQVCGFSQQDNLSQKGGYTLNANEEHCFLFVLANRPNDLQEMRTGITKYIWKYYPDAKLKVTQIQIDGDLKNVPLIHIGNFKNKGEAMAFHNGLKKNYPDFLQMGLTEDYFPVSKTNYDSIVRTKTLNGYHAFFGQNY